MTSIGQNPYNAASGVRNTSVVKPGEVYEATTKALAAAMLSDVDTFELSANQGKSDDLTDLASLENSPTEAFVLALWGLLGDESEKADSQLQLAGLTDGLVIDVDENAVPINDLKTSKAGLEALMKEEGFRGKAYWDYKGYAVGYGLHYIYENGSWRKVRKGETVTQAKAKSDFKRWIAEKIEPVIKHHVKVPVTTNMFDSLVSLSYNIGTGGFRKSTLLKKLNNKDYAGAAREFLRWNKAGGNVHPVLVARREREANRFLKEDSRSDQPLTS
ncbi:MAG: lysozyme [Vampirovibrio sp.]|nr:lysozyme [Vampirovibrio sp.]